MLIGTDRTIFLKESTVRRRVALLGKTCSHGLDSIVFSTRSHGILHSQEIAPHVYAHPTRSLSRFLYIWNAYRVAKNIQRPDIISTQDPFETGWAGFFIARYFKVPFVVEIHTDFLSPLFIKHSFLNRLRVYFAGFILKRAAGGYAVSEKIKNEIEKHYPNLSLSVLPIYVDINRFKKIIHTPHPRFKITLLWVGRMEKEKNPMLALQAFIVARKKGIDVGIIFVGTGSLLDSLKFEVEKANIKEWVEFAGESPHIEHYYAYADLLLVTSIYEGYSMVIVEALAAGIPVLSTDVGIAREAGAIITPMQKDEYASSLVTLTTEPQRRGVLKLPTYSSEEEYFAHVIALYQKRASENAK